MMPLLPFKHYSSKTPFLENPYLRMLLHWRWFALFIGIVVFVIIELSEGHRLDDLRLYAEILTYGLIGPFLILSWFLLTLVAHHALRRQQSEHKFELHRRFTQQLVQRQEWGELTRFVTQFPGTFLPITRASLYIYDHRDVRFEFVAEWNANGLMSFGRPFNACPACSPVMVCKTDCLGTCAFVTQGALESEADEHCLSLSYDNLLIGMLKLKRRSREKFSQDQIDFIHTIAPEIALALGLAIAYPREMAQVRVKAQIEERYRAASDLHNTLAQQIGYLHFNLDRLTNDERLDGNEVIRVELENMRQVADEAYRHVRQTLAHLRSQEVFDLSQAIADYAQKISQLADLQIDVTTQGEPKPLPPQICQSLFDLVQEGLNNIQKHARARCVQIVLDWSADDLRLQLVDDGIGFDPAFSPRYGHYGIVMMREQVNTLRGKLVVESFPCQGTTLSFRIPFRRWNNSVEMPHPVN